MDDDFTPRGSRKAPMSGDPLAGIKSEIREAIMGAIPGAAVVMVDGSEEGLPLYWLDCKPNEAKDRCEAHDSAYGRPWRPDDACAFKDVANQAAYFCHKPTLHSATHLLTAISLYLLMDVSPHDHGGNEDE